MSYFLDEYSLLGWIPLLPLLGALGNGLFGKRLPEKAVHIIACTTIGLSFVFAMTAFNALIANRAVHGDDISLAFTAWEWMGVGNLQVDIAFTFDALSAVMCLIITGVGFLIHVYSIGYMHGDKGYYRYFTYLNLFCFAMLVLVLGDSLPVLFVGWEGVGLASYLLIGFWFTDEAKAQAGKKAFIVNRVGDFAVLLAMFMLFSFTGTLSFDGIEAFVAGLSEQSLQTFVPFATVIGLLIFVGCTGKSAQIPLYTWLPDAMAGPTPVSALIHAATMVTAGVYLCVRLNFLFDIAPTAMLIIAIIGVSTATFAATIGVVQRDIKKVLAYSTVSQLGYMFLAVGVGAYGAAIFHLMTHAFFKALLFLGAGAVIHSLHGEQDIMKMGGLKKHLPVVRWTFLIACLAISGVPLLSGFFSKDEILFGALTGMPGAGHHAGMAVIMNFMLWGGAVMTAGITAFYMFRLYFLTFEGKYRGDPHTLEHLHKPGGSIQVPLAVLAVLAAIGGYLGLPQLFHVGGISNVLGDWLAPVLAEGGHGSHSTFWEIVSMLVGTAAGLSGIGIAYVLYMKSPARAEKLKANWEAVHDFVFNKYYIDELYDRIVVRPMKRTGELLYKWIDRLLIDQISVEGSAHIFQRAGKLVREFQNGNVQRYAFFMLFGLTLTLILVWWG